MGKWFCVPATIVAMMCLLCGGTAAAQSRAPKVKRANPSSAAGAISQPKTGIEKAEIYGDYSSGFHCVGYMTANTHSLGWIPKDVAITIDFDSTDESDPIAVLSSIQFTNAQAGGERFNSDDEGGNLNPYFRMMKPYDANWVLTVGTADGGMACYSFKVTLQ